MPGICHDQYNSTSTFSHENNVQAVCNYNGYS